MINSSVLVQENYAIKTLLHVQEVEIGLGEVEITDRVIGYRKIQTHSNDTMSTYKLDNTSIDSSNNDPLTKASGQIAGDDRRA